MAKGKPGQIIDLISGAIQGIDRTIGRDKGFLSVIRKNPKPTKNDKTHGYSITIAATKTPTTQGSKARHDRATVYCGCDKFYQGITDEKRAYLLPWWIKASGKAAPNLSNYTVWMKICLKNLIEKTVFMNYVWLSRYSVTNDTDEAWTDVQVQCSEIPTNYPDHSDASAFQLTLISVEKDGTMLDPKMIWTQLTLSMTSETQGLVTVPSLAPGATMLIDIYSYAQG